ncbi:MAG TPA: hypothetical protein VGQ19_01350 [Burkholderiales bacterium]|nr:hypothetical protein [Burkholderiales bacterium]
MERWTIHRLAVDRRRICEQGQALNNKGAIVGAQRMGPDTNDPWHACKWKNGIATDLGTLEGFPSSHARDVNGTDQVVGILEAPPGYLGDAVIWHDGAITVLNDVVPANVFDDLHSSFSINDAGQILVASSGYSWHAILTPVTPGPTDINGACRTNTGDLLIVIYEWGETDSPADVAAFRRAWVDGHAAPSLAQILIQGT